MERLSSIRMFLLCMGSIPHTFKTRFVKQFGGGALGL